MITTLKALAAVVIVYGMFTVMILLMQIWEV
jgi:hypothetical protein